MKARRVFNELRYNANAQSSALGLSRLIASVRAGMEAYERCATAFRGDEYSICTTTCELGNAARPAPLLHPEAHAAAIRDPLPDSTLVEWTPVWSLTHSAIRWVLMSFCFFGFPRDRQYFVAHSRGLAAGPALEFCVLNGIYELIETVALTKWERLDQRFPYVDLGSFQVPVFDDLLRFHERKGRDLWVLDISMTIPALSTFAFVAISYDPVTKTIVFGSAAHNDAEKGIRASLLECTQMLPNLLLDEKQQLQLARVSYHLQERHRWKGYYNKTYYDAQTSSRCSLQDLINSLANSGIEVLVKDLTRKQVPIHVARVIFSAKDIAPLLAV